MPRVRFWLRWSGRDLRQRWIVVAAIALLIAVGTGVYASLASLLPWQTGSYDANFAALHTHDLRVALAPGAYVREGALVRAARSIADADSIRTAAERLIVPTQVDASRPGTTILVPGRIVGVQLSRRGPPVDTIATRRGQPLTSADAGRLVAMLEFDFATHYHLASTGTVRLEGGTRLPYIGLGQSPEDFVVVSAEGVVDASESFAVVYVPLAAAQRVSGHPGQVNDLVLTLRAGASVTRVRTELARALATRLPSAGASLTAKSEITAHRVLYTDARGEQRMYNIFGLLLLGGAAFAAFNLLTRIVESERRQIGIGLALGAGRAQLAIRPLLMAAEVALLGVAFGVVVGLALDEVLRGVIGQLTPLPFYRTPFELGAFARAAALGFVLPFAACAYPIWNAVRRRPIEAIQVGVRAARGAGLAPVLRRIPLPGRSLVQMPARDLLRRPGRTLTTMLGLAVVITILLAVLGILDSVSATSGAARREMLGNTPTRTIVTLDHLYPQDAPRLKTISSLRAVGGVQASLRITGTLRNGRRSVPAIVELIDSRAGLWRPTIQAGSELAPGTPGILISAKAASDLGTGPGKAISFVYFRPAGDSSFRLAKAPIRVLGIHRNPIRTFAFLDASRAKVLGYGGLVNTLSVVAAHDVSQGALERALFSRPGVLSVEPASAVPDVSRDRLNDFLSIFHVVEAIALGLALLIAFNSTSISAEERARDHATMFAFGLPVRAVVAVAAAESFLIGLLGTAIAIVPGYVLLGWILRNYLEKTYPDLGLLTSISTTSAGVIVLVGVVAVALAPVLTIRALRHMDVPAKLRTIE